MNKFIPNFTVYARTPEIQAAIRKYAKELNQADKDKTPSKPAPAQKPATATQTEIDLPDYIADIMNGGVYPEREDLTRDEQQVLYDEEMKRLIIEYRKTKSGQIALSIQKRLSEIC